RAAAGCGGRPPMLDRLLAAIVLAQLVAIIYQCLVFLRTDLYFVLLTALGCRDLHRVTRLYLRSRLVGLTADQAAALAGAHPRDRRGAAPVARRRPHRAAGARRHHVAPLRPPPPAPQGRGAPDA